MSYENVSVVILAAGLSRRMGDVNKLLLPYRGRTLIRHTVTLYEALGVGQIIVVVGFQQDKVRAALQGVNADIVANEAYQQGQITSIRRGFKAIRSKTETVLVALGDLPLLTAEEIQFVLSAYLKQSSKSIAIPHFQGQRGHPIVISATQARAVDEEGVVLGCRKLIDKFPDKVLKLEMPTSGIVEDLDSPADVDRLLGISLIEEI